MRKSFAWWLEEDKGREPKRMRDIVEWEIVLSKKHVHGAMRDLAEDERWRAALPELLDDFVGLLRDALDLMRELGEADETSDYSYVHQPSIAEDPGEQGFPRLDRAD